MDALKYLHTDGKGKVYVGLTAEELAAQSFCSQVFGILERPLEANEQISSTTGSIEQIPQSEEQAAAETEKQAILALLSELDAGTATTSEAQAALAYVIRKITA